MITFVCGQLCSGKTHYAKALTKLVDGVFIEVGDIVRDIKKTNNRTELQNTKNLHEQIVTKLKANMTSADTVQYVVSGVRQTEILKCFPEATILWIECPKTEREKRYNQRARTGDELVFATADQGDINLGIIDVKRYIFNL
jgi:cytidylate kinase